MGNLYPGQQSGFGKPTNIVPEAMGVFHNLPYPITISSGPGLGLISRRRENRKQTNSSLEISAAVKKDFFISGCEDVSCGPRIFDEYICPRLDLLKDDFKLEFSVKDVY